MMTNKIYLDSDIAGEVGGEHGRGQQLGVASALDQTQQDTAGPIL